MPAKKPKPEEKPQRERFIEAAQEAEADETEKGAEKAFGKVVISKTDVPPDFPVRGKTNCDD